MYELPSHSISPTIITSEASPFLRMKPRHIERKRGGKKAMQIEGQNIKLLLSRLSKPHPSKLNPKITEPVILQPQK